MTTATVLAENLQRAWGVFVTRGRRPQTAHPSVYASAWRLCDRRMALELTQPENLPPFEPDVLQRFRRGEDRERDMIADMIRIGRDSDPPFKLHAQQERFVLKDHQGRPAIVGKVDARIEVNGARPPVEFKAWNPVLVERLRTFGDLFENPWTKSGGYQMLGYLLGAGEPYGLFIVDRSGLPLILPVVLEEHLDRIESFLARAEHVLDHVEAGTLPDYLEGEPDECLRCPWFGDVCDPPIDGPGDATILLDPALEAALERRESLRTPGKEFADLDREIKDRLRGVEHGIIGKFEVKGRWGKQSRVVLPEALKKQYTETDPKGRFTLEITKLG